MRVRRHANPFSVRVSIGTLDRAALFGRVAPLEVEIGCGAGAFLLERALHHPELDFVGFEIREPLVERASGLARDRGVSNLVYLHANASTNLRGLVPPGSVLRFHVHFPDPCFKKRHWKRRQVQPFVVRQMSELLPVGGAVYAQSDVLPLAEEMYACFAADGALESRLDAHMLVERPVPESTEWERQHERENEPIYRMWFEKVREPEGPLPDFELRETQPKRGKAP
jgi:tRNA (guanine-N7-)-methyltransferase